MDDEVPQDRVLLGPEWLRELAQGPGLGTMLNATTSSRQGSWYAAAQMTTPA